MPPLAYLLVFALLFLGVIVWGMAWSARVADRAITAERKRQRAQVKHRGSEVKKEHPVLGTYWSWADEQGGLGRWSCTEYRSDRLGYSFCLVGAGSEPTLAQIERLKEIERRMPEIIAAIPPPPDDDGWGNSFPEISAATALINDLEIHMDQRCSMLVGFEPRPLRYSRFPGVEVSTDWEIEVRWIV